MNYPLRRRLPVLTLQETFLRMASMTTPHGHESFCWPLIPTEGHEIHIDSDNNFMVWVRRPDDEYSNVMWSSHLDTADHGTPRIVNFRRTKKNKISTDGTSILGADCKIGAAIMCKMIEANIPGWYIFHAGEERGLLGARANARRKWPYIPNIAIAFDRKDRNEIITHQAGRRCASDAFAKAFAAVLNKQKGFEYRPSPDGVYTDTQAYADIVPECTNIGVGYFKQHTHEECQDMDHAERLLDVILRNADAFEELPCPRDPKKDNESRYAYNNYTGGNNSKGGSSSAAPTHGGMYRDGRWYSDEEDWSARTGSGEAQGNNSPKVSGASGTTSDTPPDPNDEAAYIAWWKKKGYATDGCANPPQEPTFCCNQCGCEDQGYANCRECGNDKMVKVYNLTPDAGKKCHHCKKCRRVEFPENKWDADAASFCYKCGDPMKILDKCPHLTIIKDGDGFICDDCDHKFPVFKPTVKDPPFEPTKECPSVKIVQDAKMSDVIPIAEEDKGSIIDAANTDMNAWMAENSGTQVQPQLPYTPHPNEAAALDAAKRGNVRGIGGLGKAKKMDKSRRSLL